MTLPLGGAVTSRLAVLALILLVLGVPITDFWRFLLLTVAVMAICFGQVRVQPLRWLIAMAIALTVVSVDWLLPGPRIEEGHNVYIPVGAGLEIFERGLPPDAQRAMLAVFNRAYLEGNTPSPGSPDWWQHPKFKKPGVFTKQTFAPSADGLWQTPKYSRIVDAIKFRSQNQARIDTINLKIFNFYDRSRRKKKKVSPGFNNSARIDRAAMPFFVMFEINPSLVGGKVCWRGDVLWEKQPGQFAQQHKVDRACQEIAADDLGKRIFYLAIAPQAPPDFAVYASVQQRVALWIKLLLRSLAVLAVLGALIRIDAPVRLLLPLGAALSTLLTFIVFWSDLPFGFRTHEGGNDGLTHESFGFNISQAAAHGDFQSAIQGGEDIFYFMPALRYLRALEDFLFGSTSFGVVLCTMFIPIFLFFVLRRFLPLRWSVVLIVLFMFTPILERFGFAQFLYVREMWKGFSEPIGYGAFLGALALVAQHIPSGTRPLPDSTMPTVWIGLAVALSIAMRPNLAIASMLLMAMLGLWLVVNKKWKELAFLAIGVAPIFLVAIHNWYFGGRFVPLTSAALISANLITPPSTYIAAINEVLHLDWVGPNLARVGRQLGRWNHLADIYRLPILLVTVWVVLRPGYDMTLRGLALIALSMQAVLFFYVPSGRYAYLAWLLVFVVFVVALKETFLPWMKRNLSSLKIPQAAHRFR